MQNWIYEIYNNETNKIIHKESGFETESEAEACANLYININKTESCYVRTKPLDK